MRERVCEKDTLILSREKGSAVLFSLFACLVLAITVQVVAAMVVCAGRVLADEERGRLRLSVLDSGLCLLCDEAQRNWGPSERMTWDHEGGSVEGRLASTGDGGEWLVLAEVADSREGSTDRTSVLVERGRDGIDLPLAAVVAGAVHCAEDRSDPWLTRAACGEEGVESAIAWLHDIEGSGSVDVGCEVRSPESVWSLGDGWAEALAGGSVKGERVTVLKGETGEILRPPGEGWVSSADSPVLIIALGGADLDMSGQGEIWGIVAVEDGSVKLDGTVLRGAVFAAGDVDLGVSGVLVYTPDVLHWARDRSLQRVRLVPGTRVEGNE